MADEYLFRPATPGSHSTYSPRAPKAFFSYAGRAKPWRDGSAQDQVQFLVRLVLDIDRRIRRIRARVFGRDAQRPVGAHVALLVVDDRLDGDGVLARHRSVVHLVGSQREAAVLADRAALFRLGAVLGVERDE